MKKEERKKKHRELNSSKNFESYKKIKGNH